MKIKIDNTKTISGDDASSIVDTAIPNLGGFTESGDFVEPTLEDFRAWATETIIDQAQIQRQDFLTPGKDITYIEKQRETRLFNAGETDPANLPYMTRRATRRTETLQQVRNGWQARIDAVRNADLNVEDAYETAIEAIEDAISIDEIKMALVAFLE